MFKNRADAGKQLARILQHLEDERPVILALPRGGVPVGFEIAKALHAPLDVVLVRKIGVPWQPELAVAAVVNGDEPEMVINEEIAKSMEANEEFLQKERNKGLKEIERRRQLYLGDRPRVPIRGRTVIVVDDGIATGTTCRAALRAVRRADPKFLVLAVPVAPLESIESFKQEAEEIICMETPHSFGGVSMHYASFPQLSDAEVTYLLSEVNWLLKS